MNIRNYQQAIELFIENKKYRLNDNVLGILLYGSHATGTASIDSDIDILVVTSDGLKSARGESLIDNFSIEYFIKPLSLIRDDHLYKLSNRDNYYLSVFNNGQIIHDTNNTLADLTDEFKVELPLELFPRELDYRRISEMKNDLASFKLSKDSNSPITPVLYYSLLEKLRDSFHRLHGFSNLSNRKVPYLYQNREFATHNYFCTLPDDDYIYRYLSVFKNNDIYQEEGILDLFKDLSINTIESTRLPFLTETKPFLSSLDINRMFISMYHYYQTSLDEISSNSMFCDSYYYLAMEKVKDFYIANNNCAVKDSRSSYLDMLNSEKNIFSIDNDFSDCYLSCLETKNNFEKKNRLQALFNCSTKDYNFSPHNYEFVLRNKK